MNAWDWKLNFLCSFSTNECMDWKLNYQTIFVIEMCDMCPTQDLWTSIHQKKKDESALRDDCHCPDSQVTTLPVKMLFGLSDDVRHEITTNCLLGIIRLSFCTNLDHAWMGHYQIFKNSKWNERGLGLIIAFLRLLFKLSNYIIAALIDVRIWCQTWSS